MLQFFYKGLTRDRPIADPCMSRAGKRGVRRKGGRDIDGLWGLFMSRLGGEIRKTFYVECAKYKFQQSFVLRAQESDLQARKAVAK